ncbi:TonB-dependent receptor [Lysobacter sp. CFH 32150]|uniref:TonB-dependent receptor n=1 Tax=Lysobacter sp. CFH 32150 TaxID=2927128 RepID=UPI001FA74369|nr:TonB-dependent receptor [Lysobacter sp. CFH 32150]MCI4567392.1 TonB-dependent receptor [Lysobacter sp. CFH 32150]
MASQYFAKGLKWSALPVALALCFVGGAQAQSNTAGAVAGRAAAGDSITIANPANGFSRTITVDENGGFRLSQLPIGQYVLTRKSVDGTTTARNATVNIGFTANIDFVSNGNGTGAINPIDVSSVESTTILTAEQIAKIPVARDTTSVALLAPGTVRGDAAFGNLASFGGSSVAENQYFINGFNITNSFRGLNFAQVPFEAIAEQQIKAGGYGAEFGRSLGGVVNQITKRGTNEFHAGGNIFWSPEDLREDVKNVHLANGTLRQDNSNDSTWNTVASVWASGALVKDRLFAYGLLSYGRNEAETWGNVVASTNTSAETKNPNWLLKMDWNITDSHLLELTAFSDKQDTETDVYRNRFGQLDRTDYLGTRYVEQSGDNYVLNYTGTLTDNFTLSALAGRGEFERKEYVVQASGLRLDDANGNHDTRRQFRLGGEWQLGEHLLRFGYDRDDYQSRIGSLDQDAYYIEDSWSITSNFVAYFGGRWDHFENTDSKGRSFIRMDQFSPRTGFSWDVNGDSTFKVFASAGRHAMAPPPSVNLRYRLTDPIAIAAKNLEPMYQDEYILGLQKQLTGNATLGVRGIFRDLKSAIEDTCDYTAILEANGYDPDAGPIPALPNPGFPYCRIFNPGEDAVFVTNYYGDGRLVENVIPGARLSPKARRTYSAIEFFFDGNWDRLFLHGSYTYAKSKGNIEGGVKSDTGDLHTNVTEDFDYLELTTDTYGYLPNDRRHSLKLFGSYAFTEAWSAGANLLVQSGRPTNCLGVLDLDPSPTSYRPHPYGSAFMRCGVTAQGDPIHRPRGTAGRLPWATNLDLNVAYQPSWAAGVRFKMDIFNVLNSQKVTSQVEQAEIAATGLPSDTYRMPLSFQAPRSFRFMVQYDF